VVTTEHGDTGNLSQFRQMSVETRRIHRVNDPDTVLTGDCVTRSFPFLLGMG
jgi:hypothetical protein